MTKNTAGRPHQSDCAEISHKSGHFVCQTLSNRHQEGGQPQVGGQDRRGVQQQGDQQGDQRRQGGGQSQGEVEGEGPKSRPEATGGPKISRY